ncbi:tyrosine-type recombinase/integrase [Heyndrickxia acidicola]|uniref:Site-specific integrase n=1 Tax=Heyndrickxia acidicola TaxID=209389 RepID=A0ABU6MBH4_9BACI|nr:site-specific integrase [Heyndrickxia acidicola]MED1201774.1 site-specific integrase [Heyndrickxia acidicola]
MFNAEIYYDKYIVDWLKGKRYSISQQTYQVNESYIRNQIIPLLGDYSLSQLNPMILQQFINELIDKGLANSSVKRIFSIVHSSLDMAEKMQLIPKNYASFVHKPKLRRKELQVWDVREVQHFLTLASKDPYTYMAFHLALLTGMRQGEILGLRWIDIDFENQLLFVRQTLSHDGKEFIPGAKTASGVRSIALDQDTIQLLKRHLELVATDKDNKDYKDGGLVVCTNLGEKIPPRMIMRVWYKLLRDSHLPKITFHDLRHTHASLLLKNNVHPKVVSERLGHSSIQITLDTYSHLLPNMQKEAAGKFWQTLLSNFTN